MFLDNGGSYECVPLGWFGSESMIRVYSDHGRSNEPMNPCPEWIHRFIWSTMIRVISSRISDPDRDHLKGRHPKSRLQSPKTKQILFSLEILTSSESRLVIKSCKFWLVACKPHLQFYFYLRPIDFNKQRLSTFSARKKLSQVDL